MQWKPILIAAAAFALAAAGGSLVFLGAASAGEGVARHEVPYMHPQIDDREERLVQAYELLKARVPEKDRAMLDQARDAYLDYWHKTVDFCMAYRAYVWNWWPVGDPYQMRGMCEMGSIGPDISRRSWDVAQMAARLKEIDPETPKPRVADHVSSGLVGIDALVREGKLSYGTKADIEAWIERASLPYRRYNDRFRVKVSTITRSTIVVVRGPFEIPEGFRGSDGVSFIIPEGAPMPTGFRWQHRFYFMETGRCSGSQCCE